MNESIRCSLARHLGTWRRSLDAGAERLGWKVAFNQVPIQQRLGLSGSLVAALTRATLEDESLPHSLSGATRAALEAEVAVYLDVDLSSGMTAAEAAQCIGHWGPAIEIVDFNRPLDDLEAILAEGVFHRAVRLGATVPTAPGADLSGILARIDCAGRNVCEVDAKRATGHAPDVLLHLARILEPLGERLSAGDVVILGSMNPLTFAEATATFSLELTAMRPLSVDIID